MIQLLIPAYLVWFGFVSVAGIRLSLQEKEPLTQVTLDAAFFVLAMAGFVLYHLGICGEPVPAVWRILGPFLVVVYLWQVVRDLRNVKPASDFTSTENVWVNTIGAWLAILTNLPALWFNLALGFGC